MNKKYNLDCCEVDLARGTQSASSVHAGVPIVPI